MKGDVLFSLIWTVEMLRKGYFSCVIVNCLFRYEEVNFEYISAYLLTRSLSDLRSIYCANVKMVYISSIFHCIVSL